MALTVGELNAVLSVDDRAVSPALRRAENALRSSGQQMGDDAERTGQQAGEGLGEGIVRGADGRLRNARGQFVAAGRRGGDAVGEGLTDGAADGADEAVEQTTSRMDRLKMAAAGVGLAAGALLMDSFMQAMEQSQISGRLAAQLGATPAEAQRYGKVAGQLYADAVTADFQTAADTISAVMRAGIAPPDATEAQLKRISTQVSDLATTFDLDLGQAANAVGQTLKTGLAKNGTEAVDALTAGLQRMGPRADDIADTFNEYSTIFRNLGLDVTTTTGLLTQGMAAGARDTDVVADALKELTLITQGGGKAVDEAFGKIGLSGKKMQAAFSEGGPAARKALDEIFDRLRKVKDPADRAQLAVALFGTKAEDTQKALFSLDPSKAVDALGKVGGKADEMGNRLRDNSGARLEAFKRGLQQGVVDFLGNQVIPPMMKFVNFLQDHSGEVKAGAALITAVVVPALTLLGAKALWAGMQMARAWILGLGPIGWIGLIIGGLVVLIIAYWDEIKAYTLIAWNWVVAKVKGAVNLLLAGIDYLGTIPGKVSAWFGQMKDWAIKKLLALVAWITGLPGRVSAAVSSMASKLSERASAAWQAFQVATAKKVVSFISYVRGLPGRISAGIGSLNRLLVSKGVAVVQGLWSGISSMGGWIKSKLLSWARSMIPGPIAKALGIASPSKVTKAQGRWIARGLIDGLTGSSKQVKAASGKLADIIADSLRPGKKRSQALAKLGTGTKQLLALAKREEALAAKMKTANKKLDDLRKAREKLAKDVTKGVLDSADITKQDNGGWPVTAASILAGLQQDTAAAQQFAKNLAALRKKGIRADLVAQIAQAGVEQGSAAAAALANANGEQVKQINAQQKLLVGAADQAGATAGDAMYGAGIAAGQGIVRGLQNQQKAIERQMLKIAQGMSKSIRKALGIKSPSRVMALVGQYTAQGLIRGVEGQRTAVNRSMASLVETPSPGSWDMAGARARAAASQKVVLELRSSGRAEDDYLMERMRRGIRKKGGGDVGLVLAGRRSS
ncbi:phage tail tape measure protein [Streptomyces luteogriseus]|uniref:phage tail tape measure protein n=1 Tax=Streptomyces luteogriseus TaxID=68233 RepID=UPI0037A56586